MLQINNQQQYPGMQYKRTFTAVRRVCRQQYKSLAVSVCIYLQRQTSSNNYRSASSISLLRAYIRSGAAPKEFRHPKVYYAIGAVPGNLLQIECSPREKYEKYAMRLLFWLDSMRSMLDIDVPCDYVDELYG